MSERNKAIRRTIETIHRTGGYGGAMWLHTLECGHTEGRKRKAPTAMLACVKCSSGAVAPDEDYTDLEWKLAIRLGTDKPVITSQGTVLHLTLKEIKDLTN